MVRPRAQWYLWFMTKAPARAETGARRRRAALAAAQVAAGLSVAPACHIDLLVSGAGGAGGGGASGSVFPSGSGGAGGDAGAPAVTLVGHWGDVGAQQPWTPARGGPLAVTEAAGAAQLADRSGTARAAAAGAELSVVVALDGQDAVEGELGTPARTSVTLLSGAEGALAPTLTLVAGSDAAVGAQIHALAVGPGIVLAGRQDGGPLGATLPDDRGGFSLFGADAANPERALRAGVDPGDPAGREVVLFGAARSGSRTYVAGAHYGGAPPRLSVDGLTLDCEPPASECPVPFPATGDGLQSYALLLAADDAGSTLGALGFPEIGPLGTSGYARQELLSVAARGSRVVAAGRSGGVMRAAGFPADLAAHVVDQPADAAQYAPVLFEVDDAGAGAEPFTYVWHLATPGAGEPFLAGELRAVTITERGDVVACGAYRGGAPAGCPGPDDGWFVVVRRASTEEIVCVASPSDGGTCTSVVESGGTTYLAGMDGGAPPRGLVVPMSSLAPPILAEPLTLPAPAAVVTALAPAPGGVYVSGSFLGSIGETGGAVTSAIGGATDWDLFVARLSYGARR